MTSVEKIFEEMGKRLTPEKASQINASYLFKIGKEAEESWLVDLTKNEGWVSKGSASSEAQCTISIANGEDWVSLASGKINPTMAFMQGKIKVKGNMSLALKLQSILS